MTLHVGSLWAGRHGTMCAGFCQQPPCSSFSWVQGQISKCLGCLQTGRLAGRSFSLAVKPHTLRDVWGDRQSLPAMPSLPASSHPRCLLQSSIPG